jgi:tricarballylate dehydrogenase
VHQGLDGLAGILDPDERSAAADPPPYSAEAYLADMEKVTAGRNNL